MTMLKKVYFTSKPSWIAWVFLFGYFTAPFGNTTEALSTDPDGFIGWSYYVAGRIEFTNDPVKACRLTAKNHMNTPLADMRLNRYFPNGTSYDCRYSNFLLITGPMWYGNTSLQCKSGFSAKSPGVCVSKAQPLVPASCAIGTGGYVVANPINVASGGKFQNETDLVVGSSGSMKVTRTYRTFRGFALGQSAGPEWSFSFDRVFLPIPVLSGHYYTIEGSLEEGNYFKFEWDNVKKKYTSVLDKAATLEELGPEQDDFLLTQGGIIDHFKKLTSSTKSTFALITSQRFDGSKTFYNYDPITLRLTEIKDEQGRTIMLNWRPDGAIESISSAENTVAYNYDAPIETFPSMISKARLRSVDYMDNLGSIVASKKYDYDDSYGRSHLLTDVTDENDDRYAHYAYDSAGRAILSEHGNGAERHTLAYPDENIRVITDPLGTVRTIRLRSINGIALTTGVSQPGGSGCNAASNAISHDYSGNVVNQTDFDGNKVCFAYESGRGLEIARFSGFPSTKICPATSDTNLKVGERLARTAWHGSFPLKTASSEPGMITRYFYNGEQDSNGKTISCTSGMMLPNQKPFPILCRKTEQITSDIDGGKGFEAAVQGAVRSWEYIYDEHGKILKASRPETETGQREISTFTYYVDTNSTHLTGDLATVTNGVGETTQYLEYSPDGLITKIARADTVTVNIEYDARKNRTVTKLVDSTGNTETTSYEYDRAGNLIRTMQPDHSSVILSYDAAHRLTRLEDTAGNSVNLTLDGAGNITNQETRGPDQKIFAQFSRSYDSLNRLQHQKNGPDDIGIMYQYDANGNMTSIIDPLGRRTNRQYDNFNRLVSVQTPAPHLDEPRGLTSFKYDNRDLLTSVTDPRLLTTNYTVDSFGQRLGTNSPDTGVSSNSFNAGGDLQTSTDARNIKTIFRWDAARRIRQSGTKVFEYVPTNSVGAGRLSLLQDESGQTSFAYDGMGRVHTKTHVINLADLSHTFKVTYDYGSSGNATGHPTSITYPSGTRLDLQYGTEGRVTDMSIRYPGSDIAVPLLKDIQYSPLGQLASWSWGNSTSASLNKYARTFDEQGRLLSYPLGSLQTGGVVRTLQYDSVGRITATSHGGTTTAKLLDQQYEYDDLDRVISFRSNGVTQSYSYDSNGNRIRTLFGAALYSNLISPTSNRMASATGPAPAKRNLFDSSGNLVYDGTTNFSYGADGRMATSTASGLTTTYWYNGFGQRVAKKTSTGANFYVYNEEGLLLGEYDTVGRLIQETVYVGRVPVAVITVPFAANTSPVIYVFSDHLDSPRVLSRADKNRIVWRWDQSDPFGVLPPDEDPSHLGKFVYNLRFPGQYYDKETNLHYNYFRDYDPMLGRYVQSDPVGLHGGTNTYTYVNGNPLSYIDPFGLTRQQVAAMLRTVRCNNPDLNVPSKIYISHIFGGEDTAITDPITLNVRLSSYYDGILNADGLISLYKTITHESIHRTRSRFDMIMRPLSHDDIYAEAKLRAEIYSITGGINECSCR